MNLVTTRIEIGLAKPLRFLHLSDSHLTFADERDSERKQLLAEKRTRDYAAPDCVSYLKEGIAYAGKHCDLLLHTGDLIDFVSYRNLDLVREYFAGLDYFIAAGNHEFSKYVGEAFEDEAYKLKSLPIVQPAFANDLRFASRQIGGVNLVGIDNTYYLFSESALPLLQKEIGKGLPILLLMHNPIYTEELHREMTVNRRRECSYLVGCPPHLVENYSEERRRQQMPDAATLAFLDFLRGQPLVKAIFAGHLHFHYESKVFGWLPQYVTGGTFKGDAREIIIT